ncbi:DA1 [Prunus dulcis]|uniref:DA1 n=1 Tax=Prunus dulcis TaxID=3755 RepID=A0A5E4G3N0_PRUDU|nr:DA1 [Prunus dulcis]
MAASKSFILLLASLLIVDTVSASAPAPPPNAAAAADFVEIIAASASAAPPPDEWTGASYGGPRGLYGSRVGSGGRVVTTLMEGRHILKLPNRSCTQVPMSLLRPYGSIVTRHYYKSTKLEDEMNH